MFLGEIQLRAHGEFVVFAEMDGQVAPCEVGKRVKLVCSIEVFIIFAVGTFNFTVMSRISLQLFFTVLIRMMIRSPREIPQGFKRTIVPSQPAIYVLPIGFVLDRCFLVW